MEQRSRDPLRLGRGSRGIYSTVKDVKRVLCRQNRTTARLQGGRCSYRLKTASFLRASAAQNTQNLIFLDIGHRTIYSLEEEYHKSGGGVEGASFS